MDLDINVGEHHLTHEGKLPEAQEFMLQGKEIIYETPSEHLDRLQVLQRLLKLQDRTLRPVPVPGINTSNAAIAYKAGLNLWGIQLLSAEGLLGGYNFFNGGATQVEVLFFDGGDSSGNLLISKAIPSLGDREIYFPWSMKLNNGLFIGFAGTAAAVALTIGTVFTILE